MSEKQLELPIIQKTYDLILWYVPRLNKLPRNFKHVLGDRIQSTLYGLLEGLIRAKYHSDKAPLLDTLNVDLEILRYQTRLCNDLGLLDLRRFEYVSRLINEIGTHLGGWIRQQKRKSKG